jgi:hypothetical protein
VVIVDKATKRLERINDDPKGKGADLLVDHLACGCDRACLSKLYGRRGWRAQSSTNHAQHNAATKAHAATKANHTPVLWGAEVSHVSGVKLSFSSHDSQVNKAIRLGLCHMVSAGRLGWMLN